MIILGSAAQVVMSNQKKKLNWKENATIILTCGLIGGTWALYWHEKNNTSMILMTGIISLIGNNISKALVLIARDPKFFIQIIKDKINKLL